MERFAFPKSSFNRVVLVGIVGFAAVSCSRGMNGGSDSQDKIQRALLLEESSSMQDDDAANIPAVTDAHYYYMLGELALSDNRLDEAEDLFAQAAKIDPGPAPTLRKRLVQLYIRDKDLDKALGQLELALQDNNEDVELLKLKAGVLASLKRTDEAIATYQQIITKGGAPEEEPHIFAASLYLQNNDLDSARDILLSLLKTEPDSFFGHYYLARIEEAKTNYPAAEQYYKKAIKLSPQADSVKLDLARMYGSQKRFEEGIAICEEIVKTKPKNVDARSLLGQLLLGRNDVKQALQQFEAVSALQEDPTKTRFRMALIKLQQKDFAGAETELNLVLAQHPENDQARYYLAYTYANLNRIEESLKQIDQITGDGEYEIEAKTLGVFLLRQSGKREEAVNAVKDLIAKKGEDIQLLTFLAGLQRETNQIDDAIETMNRIIQLEPENDQHYFTLGVYYDDKNDRATALKQMEKAVEINANNGNALNYLGYSYAETGQNLDQAEALVRRALEQEPDNGYFLDSLGWVYYRMGKLQDAKRELERAVKLVPDDAVLLEHLGIVYKALNDRKKATEVVRKGLENAPKSDDKEVGGRLKTLLDELSAN